MIKLSKADAQRIQAEHIEWCGRTYGLERVRALVMAADRSHLLTDGEHDIVIREREAEHQARLRGLFAGDDGSCKDSLAAPQPDEHDRATALHFIASQGARMIRKFLDVSSGHLSEETWTWLDKQLTSDKLHDPHNSTAAQIAGGPTRYGWFVFAPKDTPYDFPADLLAVLKAGLCRRLRLRTRLRHRPIPVTAPGRPGQQDQLDRH